MLKWILSCFLKHLGRFHDPVSQVSQGPQGPSSWRMYGLCTVSADHRSYLLSCSHSRKSFAIRLFSAKGHILSLCVTLTLTQRFRIEVLKYDWWGFLLKNNISFFSVRPWKKMLDDSKPTSPLSQSLLLLHHIWEKSNLIPSPWSVCEASYIWLTIST